MHNPMTYGRHTANMVRWHSCRWGHGQQDVKPVVNLRALVNGRAASHFIFGTSAGWCVCVFVFSECRMVCVCVFYCGRSGDIVNPYQGNSGRFETKHVTG